MWRWVLILRLREREDCGQEMLDADVENGSLVVDVKKETCLCRCEQRTLRSWFRR